MLEPALRAQEAQARPQHLDTILSRETSPSYTVMMAAAPRAIAMLEPALGPGGEARPPNTPTRPQVGFILLTFIVL